MQRIFGAAVAATLCASPALGQFGARQLNLSVGVGANLPVGDLDNQANTGFGISVRTASGNSAQPWVLRGGISFDRFGGKGVLPGTGQLIDNYQYLTFVTDVVHNTNRKLYQFVGIGIYSAKTVTTNTVFSESDFGLQGGIGYNFDTPARTFVEFGLVDVFTTFRTSVWFPVKFGIRL